MSANSLTVDRELFKKQLTLHEGRRARLYKDSVGKWTIGIGRNLSDRPLSEAAIDFLYQEDVDNHERELAKALPWVLNLDPVRQAVLLDMAFNLGVPTLLTFRRTLQAIKDGLYDLAADYMLESLWASQVKGRAKTLANMMRTGVNPFAEGAK